MDTETAPSPRFVRVDELARELKLTHSVAYRWERQPSGSLMRLDDALSIARAIDHAETRVRFATVSVAEANRDAREALRDAVV